MIIFLATAARNVLLVRALAALFMPGLAKAASTTPTPPQQILSVFEATVRIHSAASDNTTFDYGEVAVDTTLGRMRKRLTDYYSSPQPTASDFYLACDHAQYYYAPDNGPCEHGPPLAGQCPITYPGIVIPADATYMHEEVANGVPCDVWEFYFPLYQSSVTAWTSSERQSNGTVATLVRFTGARVTTDWLDVRPAPSPKNWSVPDKCRNASV